MVQYFVKEVCKQQAQQFTSCKHVRIKNFGGGGRGVAVIPLGDQGYGTQILYLSKPFWMTNGSIFWPLLLVLPLLPGQIYHHLTTSVMTAIKFIITIPLEARTLISLMMEGAHKNTIHHNVPSLYCLLYWALSISVNISKNINIYFFVPKYKQF